jgi:hypothetical protein
MADSITCDNCGQTLVLGRNGDDEMGEIAAWLKLSTKSHSWDACTRSCAHELLDGPAGAIIDAQTEVIAEIARTIREDREVDE